MIPSNAEKITKPVADLWFSIEVYENDILLLRESHIDPIAVGDIWLVRGRDCDLVIDTGSGMLYDGDHGLAWPPSDPITYCASIRRFRQLPVNCVYTGHYGTLDRKRMLEVIDEQIADLE